MMTKLYKFVMLAFLLLVGGANAWAEDVTVGRTLDFSSAPTAYTYKGAGVVSVSAADGSMNTGTAKGLWYHTSANTTINATCYRTQVNGQNLTAYNANAYAGAQVVVASGCSFDVTSVTARVAVSANLSYRVVVNNGSSDVYTSADMTIGNYNATTATNLDVTLPVNLTLTGTNYIRLYYWFTGNSNSKYIAPLELSLTGSTKGATLGAADYSSPLWGGGPRSAEYSLNANEQIEFSFVSHKRAGSDSYNTWLLNYYGTTSGGGWVRPDQGGWDNDRTVASYSTVASGNNTLYAQLEGKSSQVFTSSTSGTATSDPRTGSGVWTQYMSDLDGASVNVKVTYNGTAATILTTVKAANGNIYYHKYTTPQSLDGTLKLLFAVENAYLTDFVASEVVEVTREWRIFEDPATSYYTWNGTHISTDFKVDTLNGNWKQRGYSYKSLRELDKAEIKINGAPLFPGLYFSCKAGSDNQDLGSLELSPKDYRVFLNHDGNGNYSSFTIKDVPANYYIVVEAQTNTEGRGISFDVTGNTSGSSAQRGDANADDTFADKHQFCWKAWGGGEYTITPLQACYIYYVAVVKEPLPVMQVGPKGDTSWYTNGDTYSIDLDALLVCDNVATREVVPSVIEWVSEDPLVATVDQNGVVTVTGPGTTNIVATLPKGATYTYNGSTWTNPHNVTASVPVTTTASYPALGTYKIANGTYPGLWGMTTKTIDDVKEGLQKTLQSLPNYNSLTAAQKTEAQSSILQIYGLPKDLSKMFSYNVQDTKGYVDMYYGSWKYWQRTATLNVSELKTYHYYSDDGDGGTKGLVIDVWDAAKNYTVGNETAKDYQSVPMDGFDQYTAHKSSNAKGEFLYTNKNSTSAADYKTAANYDYAHDKGETVAPVNGVGNPYTVPCFGNYVKFEPKKSGTITAYVLQNGTINFDANNNHLTNSVSWRPLYIVDEAGKRVDGVKAVTKQKVLVSPDDVTIDVYKDGESNGANYLKDGSGNPATYKTYVEAATETHPQFGKTYKVNGEDVAFWPERGTVEQVWGPEVTGDGWLIISKAYVKYQFPVKAGKTYYLFMNNSKVGICGYTFLPGSDEGNTSVTIRENDNVAATTHENVQVTLEQTFHTGWNSICLPFSMTESKVREWFGTNDTETHELVTYNGANYPYEGNTNVMHANFFHHVWQDIIAGMPYMLYIPEGAKALTQNVVVDNITIEGVQPNAVTYSKEYMPKESRYYDSYNEGWYTYKGIYTGETAPEGAYLVSTEGLYLLPRSYDLAGYRAYLAPPSGSSQAQKRTLANFDFENILGDEQWSNDATVINDISVELGIIPAPTAVYNLQGQVVRQNTTTLEGLPQGIYIVNGKKYLVK